MPTLKITVSDDTLPKDIVLEIEHGDGFDNNAERLGWTKDRPIPQNELDDALRNVLDQEDGSSARLEAQSALKELQNKRVPNPETSLMFLIAHIRKTIDQVLVDPEEIQKKQQLLLESLQKETDASLDARRTIGFVDKV